jgi:hypothetical protein
MSVLFRPPQSRGHFDGRGFIHVVLALLGER